MKRKVGFSKNLRLWIWFVACFLAPLSHGEMGMDSTLGGKQHMHAKESVIETFEIDDHIIDCIEVNRQPAFEHPLLMNHTLQMKPTYYPNKVRVNDYLVEASHQWNLSKSCPKGSIPIQRPQKNYLFRDDPFVSHWVMDPRYSVRQGGTENKRDDPKSHEHSTVEVRGGKYYGAKASINVWNPKVEIINEFSLTQIWVASADRMTSLEAGWLVYPKLYGEDKTRFFTLWTTDGYKTFCYNLRCPGFVQTSRNTTLDAYLQPVSVYGGQQYSIDVEIFKDRTTGNWWLRLQGSELGYWPKELVPSLAEGAGLVVFGGEVFKFGAGGLHTSTQMGSGHFSYEGFRKASFFKNIQVLDTSYVYRNPENAVVVIESPKCYDLQVGRKKDGPWGYFFFYGGPGRSEGCRV